MALAVGFAFVLGFVVHSCLGGTPGHEHAPPSPESEVSAEPEVWTCSMHPQIRAPQPGQCPICGMDLIPVEAGGGPTGPRVFTTNPEAAALMNIASVPVERRFVEAAVRMVGKVEYDETRLAYITAWVPGRIDELFVDYTGIQVNKGDHMVELYSPQLITAQEELRQAKRTVETLGDSSTARGTAQATLEAARERLRLWGLTPEQIAQAEESGEFSDHVTIYAPIGGTVIERQGTEGQYVDTGTRIYTLADLGHMWVMLDAYESDLQWLRYGQEIEFSTEAYPGEVFEGIVAFIDPVLDPVTRTADVRVNVENPDGKLKPEMFVRGVVHSRVAQGGKVMDPNLSGKWICPMHPEVVREASADCPICGMDLVPAEELGYVPVDELQDAAPLIIPATAPLITGTRAVVYVQVPDAEQPTFEGREIDLGPRAGDYYIVRDGLEEGEMVVVNGNFKIDSALQIMAKPSMMSPVEPPAAEELVEAGVTYDTPEAFREQLGQVFNAYTSLSRALADDDFERAKAAAPEVGAALQGVDMALLDHDAHMAWMPLANELRESIAKAGAANDLDALRATFGELSMALASALERFGVQVSTPVYRVHCPMAFDGEGADWLQATEDVRNPYYGASMLTCGDVVDRLDEQEDMP